MKASRIKDQKASRATSGTTWWGSFDLEIDRAGRWRVGPSTVWIERHEFEWRITHWQEEDPLDSSIEVDVPASIVQAQVPAKASGIPVTVGRHSLQKTSPKLVVAAVLADRPIVVRPEEPLFVPSGETVTLFVSTPLWIRIEVGEEDHRLTEIPSFRPSDSWFGPNTREGELCYSTSTLARLRLDDVPLRLHRAITPVDVRNRYSEALSVDRIRIPVGYLSLFRDSDGFLWTEPIEFDRMDRNDLASIEIGRHAPEYARDPQRIADPRQSHDRGLLVRTFSSLIHRITDA